MPQTLFNNTAHQEQLQKIVCKVPFMELQIYAMGGVTRCCYTWMPTYIGNVNESTLLKMLENEVSEDMQNSVRDGSYKFCSSELCPKLSEYVNFNKFESPLMSAKSFPQINSKKLHIYLNYDISCNLYCGSCRNERVIYTEDNAPATIVEIHKNVLLQITELLEHGYDLTLNITGSGDPFASPMYWSFLKSLPPDTPLKLEFSTNGTLMTREKLFFPYAKRIEFIGVSVDAATEKTYNIVRRGGSYPALIQNLNNLDRMVSDKELALKAWRLNFVVQVENYREMADFARWALSFKTVSQVWFNLIADWGHLSADEFEKKAVWKTSHPEHENFLQALTDPVFSNPKILIGNMAPFRNEAVRRMA